MVSYFRQLMTMIMIIYIFKLLFFHLHILQVISHMDFLLSAKHASMYKLLLRYYSVKHSLVYVIDIRLHTHSWDLLISIYMTCWELFDEDKVGQLGMLYKFIISWPSLIVNKVRSLDPCTSCIYR